MPVEPQDNRLPFEPSKKAQKTNKYKPKSNQPPVPNKTESVDALKQKTPPLTTKEMAVPKIVSDRMARRMALFCGIPTILGMATFITSYLVASHGLKIPNVVVVLLSTGFFGLGVLGLSYGVLSASWDEETLGSKLGWQEFGINWGRMTSAWRSNKQKNV